MNEIQERIEKVLAQIRPYLQIDGGDIVYIGFDAAHGICEVRLTGSCATCAMSPLTLRAGIERALMFGVPEVKRVERVLG